MLRTRILRPRWLSTVLIFWAAVWLALPAPADGAPLPPSHGVVTEGSADAAVLTPAEVAHLRQALLSQGLSPGDADLVLARLTPAEQAELARRAEELGAGGDTGFLIILLILVVAILLYLPMAGRMQGWW
jgi:hypothetical protein